MLKTRDQSLGRKDLLEKEMATYYSILAWRIPWTRGTWWATVHRVAKSRTPLNRLSMHRYPKLRNLVLFCVWEDVGVWAHWNHSFCMNLGDLGPVSCVFTSWASLGLTGGSGYNLMAGRWQVFSFLSVLGADAFTLEGWLWHPCLLLWQEILHFLPPTWRNSWSSSS